MTPTLKSQTQVSSFPRILYFAFFILHSAFLTPSPLRAAEVQRHGLGFEHWVADTFFGGHRASGPTDKWDIPASANVDHGHVPVNPKAVKFGQAVGMGDALRQYDIDEPFLLIVGFWEQRGEDKKFVQALALHITPAHWRKLWGPVTRDDLAALDKLVKDTSLSIKEARREALRRKRQPPFSEAVIQVNPKIDKAQRRLQCSIPQAKLFDEFAPEANRARQETAVIFGKPIPIIPGSPPRKFQLNRNHARLFGERATNQKAPAAGTPPLQPSAPHL